MASVCPRRRRSSRPRPRDAAEAKENAAKACKKERDTLGLAEFKKKYAPLNHPNGANAFGKCVSKLAKQTTS